MRNCHLANQFVAVWASQSITHLNLTTVKPFVLVLLAAGVLLLAGQRKPVTRITTAKTTFRKKTTVKHAFQSDAVENFPQRFSMQLLFR